MMHEITEVHSMNIRFDTNEDISREIALLPRNLRFYIIYILKFDGGFYKFGRAASMHYRMKLYLNDIEKERTWHNAKGFNLIYIIKYKNDSAVECALRAFCKPNRIKGEWFDMLDERLCNLLNAKILNTTQNNPSASLDLVVEKEQPKNEDLIILAKVDSIGRVMIPKHVRDAIGIAPGDLAEIAVRRRQHKKDATSDL
jgi:AbrB family looped-hinge helix DNA binding protein